MTTAGQRQQRGYAVLYVEDDISAVRALTRQAALRRWTLRPASTLEAAERLVVDTWWDVLLLDLGLPDGHGARLLEALRRRGDRRGVVVLTGTATEEQRMLELGADDFVLKAGHSDSGVLWLRLANVARRTVGKSRGRLVIGPLRCDLDTQSVEIDGQPLSLRKLLRDLVVLLAARHPAAVSFDEILACYHNGYADRRLVYRDVYELNAAVPERFRPIVRPVRGFGYRFALEEHRTASGARAIPGAPTIARVGSGE